VAVLLLIVIHGFFVAGEFGLVAADRSRLENMAEDGDRRARSAVDALRTLSFQLSGAQLGITLTSLIVGFIAEPTIGRLLEPAVEATGVGEGAAFGISVALALGLATAAEMVVGELFPKNLAIARPVTTALFIATPLRFVNRLLRPLILFLNRAAEWTVRKVFKIEPQEELTQVRSLEEIEYLIRSSRQEGTLAESEFSLLARSIRLDQKTAADALVPRTSILALESTATVNDLRAKATETGHSRFPVLGKDIDEIIGVALVKDSYRFEPDERDSVGITEVMQEPLVVPESRPLGSLLLEIKRTRKHLAIVIDEYGGTAGIITLEDVLEEVVGEIEDEYDPDERPAVFTSPSEGIHVVSAMLHPDEVKEETGFEMPDGSYETLGGFLFYLFDRIPTVGDHVDFEGWEFKVVAMEGRRIDRVLMVKTATEDDTQ
jgi:CBS domain containing-hemolysin-like protein